MQLTNRKRPKRKLYLRQNATAIEDKTQEVRVTIKLVHTSFSPGNASLDKVKLNLPEKGVFVGDGQDSKAKAQMPRSKDN
ncbi:hypothetical protein Tco_1416548, partial [Tanacetum coccineum]